MSVYFDSVIVIYLLDTVGPLNVRAEDRLAVLEAAGDEIACSDLTRLESRVKPLSLGDTQRLALLDSFFVRPNVRLTPITTAVFDRATVIRATYGFKLGDSLHLAAAVEGGCDRFLTHDKRLARFADLVVEVLP